MKRPVFYTSTTGLLLLALLLVWLGSRALDEAVLVVPGSPGKPELVRGWAIALQLWPVMLTGAIPALMIAGVLALLSLIAADNADGQREIIRLQQVAEAATARADQAEHVAQTRYAEQHACAEALRQQAMRDSLMAKNQMQEAGAAVARMQEAVEQMEDSMMQMTADTQRRLRNASATMERLRRKIERLTAAESNSNHLKSG